MTKRAFPVSKSIKNSRKPSSAAQSPMKENIHAEAVFHIRELARAGRHEQAIELATRELSAAPESASVLMDLFELRAESHTAQGKLDLALQDANAMLALADGNEPALLAQALTCKARAQIHLGDLREAAQTANQALLTAKTVEPADRLLIAKSLLVLGEAQKSISDYKLAIETARKAASLFEMGGDLSNAGRAYLIMVPANNVLGNAKESRRAALTALDLCRQAGDQLGIGAAFNGLSSTDPDIAERIRHYQKAVEAFESAGHLERQSTAFGNLGFTYAALGLFIHAHRLTTKALGMTREMGAKVGMAYWLENLFDTELKLGDLDSARTHLHEYAQLARELGDARMDASVESNFSLLRLAEGNAADAVRHAQAAVDIATRAEMGNENVHLTHLAKAQLQNNEPAAALESTTRAVEFHRAQSFKLPDSFTSQEIWWRHAQALFANKKTNEARKALEQAHGFLIDAIANVRDEGLRRSYLNKDEANRELLQFWVADGAKRGLSRKRLFAHLAVETSTREPFKRLTDTGLRLNMLHTASAIHSFLVEEATELSGGERVMLILEKEDKLEEADSFLPRGEDAQTVLASIEPFLARARISRTVELILPLQDDSTRQLTPNQKSQIGNRKSQIVAPLIAQNQILGYLYADMDSLYGAFTETDRDMLGMLANQAAVSLENVNWAQGLEQKVGERTAELNSRVEELAIINSVQAGLAAQLDIQAIYELIGEQLRGLFDSQAISIVSFDVKKGTRHYHYLLEQGQRHEIPDAAMPPLSRFMIENKRPIMINENFKERLAAIGIPSTTLPGTKPTRSLLRVPILVDDEVRGAIGLDNVDRENAFSHTDMRLLTTLAGSMSVALENARLFQEIEEARKAADAASAAKSAFLANMSHELR
ncbi:MAG: GAF domain-containing protein, partial [Chloroflexi bacterium]|nr:GAF domain-containing protein [Chloroflexota bacterium]